MLPTTHPFNQLPQELNLLIVNNLTRNDSVNLRLVNKGTRTLIDQSRILNKYETIIPLKLIGPILTKTLVVSWFATPIFLLLTTTLKHNLASGISLFFNLGVGIMISGLFTSLCVNNTNFQQRQKLHKWTAIPIFILAISTATKMNPLYGFAYYIHSLSLFGFMMGKYNHSLSSLLHKVSFCKLDLSHVKPQKFQFIYDRSDQFLVKAFEVSHLALLLLTNPIFALTGSMLIATTAKVANMYYYASQAKIHRI